MKARYEGQTADPWMATSAGQFHIKNPTWEVEVIAHSLAQTARFRGHGAFPHSVAAHACLVAMLMGELHLGDPFEGLHHDDTEAFLSDVVSPWKPLLPDFMALDKMLEQSCRRHFGLPEQKTDECRLADEVALFIEAHTMMPGRGEKYDDPRNARPIALKLIKEGWKVREMDWRDARQLYLDMHTYLAGRRA